MENLKLNRNSNENQIKAYFQKVFELSKSGEEFPIDFDEVWHLAYEKRHKAVEILNNDFMQDIDFTVITQKVQHETGFGGLRKSTKYLLSVPCLEWFIARKIKPVFEVYRKVFHKAFEMMQNNIISGLEVMELNGNLLYPLLDACEKHRIHINIYQAGGYKRHHFNDIVTYNKRFYVTELFLNYLIILKRQKETKQILKQNNENNQLQLNFNNKQIGG